MKNILEVKGLRKQYEDFSLKDISFDVPQGYIMGLIGPNGAGKTTIIKSILNLIGRDAGEITVFGMDNRLHDVEIKSRIGFVHEVTHFYDHLRLSQIKGIFAPLYEKWEDRQFRTLADRFALPMDKRFRALSRGTKMKFALALALSHDADLLVMDEPTAGLDPVIRTEFLGMLSDLIQDERKSILLSTHITSDLEKIADHITFVHKGEIVFSTTKDEVLDNWGIVKGGTDILDGGARALFMGLDIGEFGFEALTPKVEEARRYFGERAVINRASLEDIMFFVAKSDGEPTGSGEESGPKWQRY